MPSPVAPEKARLPPPEFAGTPLHNVDHRSKLGVGVDYPKPKTIGADRLANAAAAAAFYGVPCVVVDFGTAVTFDILSPGKKYIGGVIAPGLEAMTDYLHQRTAQLPKISLLEPPGPIGKSTRHAMLAGAAKHGLAKRDGFEVIATRDIWIGAGLDRAEQAGHRAGEGVREPGLGPSCAMRRGVVVVC